MTEYIIEVDCWGVQPGGRHTATLKQILIQRGILHLKIGNIVVQSYGVSPKLWQLQRDTNICHKCL